MDVFATRLKEERKINGYTQQQMADLLGISYYTYRNYESKSKKQRTPDLELLVRIADVLSVSTDYLLGREN